ncbi:hypothetical protein J2T09_002982 [Neorhizobium huautlense]|uniref:Uncharacterized protein n=1 Tax=Neorhizobium huautlense TaxID=67774 RepID=A0ABT9PUR3_9HYPH|nr:hypothetical protein [Neorhizobium huautlense]
MKKKHTDPVGSHIALEGRGQPISLLEGRAIAYGEKSPSVLPAISPTRGENTSRNRLPQLSLSGSAGLSPSPLWGGVWGGVLLTTGTFTP